MTVLVMASNGYPKTSLGGYRFATFCRGEAVGAGGNEVKCFLADPPMLVITGGEAVCDNRMGQYQLVDVVDVMRPAVKIPSGPMAGSVPVASDDGGTGRPVGPSPSGTP